MAKGKKVGVHGTDAETGRDRGEGAPKCPVSREKFNSSAMPLVVSLAGKQVIASPKQFSTGSMGWYCGDKIIVEIDGVPVKVQVGLNLTIVGSKELPA